MYGILAGCIAVMAMFLGLFALSVAPDANSIDSAASNTVAVKTVQTSTNQTASQ
jgi:hypothetical protein